MIRSLVIFTLAAITAAQDAFFDKYSFTKTMASCFGEDIYYDYLARIGVAQRECLQLPVSSLHRLDFSVYPQYGYPLHFGGDSNYVPFPSYQTGHSGYPYGLPSSYQHYQYRRRRAAVEGSIIVEEPPQKVEEAKPETQQHKFDVPQASAQTQEFEPAQHRQKIEPALTPPHQQAQPQVKHLKPLKKSPYFDKYYLLDSVNKIMAALSNYTCTLHKLNVIDEYLNLRTNQIVSDYSNLRISHHFKKDLVEGIYYCRDLTYCLPLDKPKSPLPLNLQRLLMAMKCEKETRTNACFKEDLRRNIHEFDLSLFSEEDTFDTKLNKLSAIVIGVDSLNELELL